MDFNLWGILEERVGNITNRDLLRAKINQEIHRLNTEDKELVVKMCTSGFIHRLRAPPPMCFLFCCYVFVNCFILIYLFFTGFTDALLPREVLSRSEGVSQH